MGLMNIFKKPKVEFLCLHPGALETYPIVPIHKARPQWLNDSLVEFINLKNQGNADKSVARCPGITKLYKTGWVVQSWQDIKISVDKDGAYEWACSIDESKLVPEKPNMISNHMSDSFKHSEYLKNKVPILKLQLPWAVKIPKGYNMMLLPLPYQEHDYFTVARGIYERDYGYFLLNLPLLCKGEKYEFTIEAGMPLAHLVLIKDEKIDSVTRYATKKEIQDIVTVCSIKASKHLPNFKLMKEQIKRVFEKNGKCPFH